MREGTIDVVSDAIQELGYTIEKRIDGVESGYIMVSSGKSFKVRADGLVSMHGFDPIERDKIRRSPLGAFLVPRLPIRNLTEDEKKRYAKYKYVAFEPYLDDYPVLGSYYTEDVYRELNQRGSI